MDTGKNIGRVVSLALLITATIVDPRGFEVLVRSDVQLILASVIIFLLVFVDHIMGFILGLTALVLYSRVFMAKYGISLFDAAKGGPMTPNTAEYVTPWHLKDAQNNVVDEDAFEKPYKGVNGDNVYSAQGLDAKILPGLPTTPYENLGESF